MPHSFGLVPHRSKELCKLLPACFDNRPDSLLWGMDIFAPNIHVLHWTWHDRTIYTFKYVFSQNVYFSHSYVDKGYFFIQLFKNFLCISFQFCIHYIWFGYFLNWHINFCGLFKAKSCFFFFKWIACSYIFWFWRVQDNFALQTCFVDVLFHRYILACPIEPYMYTDLGYIAQ